MRERGLSVVRELAPDVVYFTVTFTVLYRPLRDTLRGS
jgi:hypothetical protein